MDIVELSPSGGETAALLALSADWETEGSCYGYRKNSPEDLAGRRVFAATEGGEIIGYLFGKLERSARMFSVMPRGTACFEVEELYVKTACRSRGVGSALFRFMEDAVKPDADYIVLSTSAKNFRAVLHFYIDEMGMDFWSAALFKKLG